MAIRSRRPAATQSQPEAPETTAAAIPSWRIRLLWFALATVPSVLLLATTNQVCLEVASVPFLWVLPLTLYLLSFIICFDNDRWYSRQWMMPLTAVAMVCVYLVRQADADLSVVIQILVYFSALLLCAIVCHGELARRRPSPEHLTSYYLLMAAGGVAGGIFVGILSPRIFNNYYELHLGLFACAALMLVVLYGNGGGVLAGGRARSAWVLMLAAFAAFAVALFTDARQQKAGVLAVGRNFFGVLQVISSHAPFETSDQPVTELWNGRIVHGVEYTSPQLRKVPTTYFNPDSGIGRSCWNRTAASRGASA